MRAIFRKLLLAVILINYLAEFLYTAGRLVGIGLWLQPIDTSTMEGAISSDLYVFELVLVGQLFVVWLVSWLKRWKVTMQKKREIAILLLLVIPTAIDVVLVFTWNAGWPGMIVRRLFAYESWVLLTLLSIFVQITIINLSGFEVREKKGFNKPD
jgi:hypothetical protein